MSKCWRRIRTADSVHSVSEEFLFLSTVNISSFEYTRTYEHVLRKYDSYEKLLIGFPEGLGTVVKVTQTANNSNSLFPRIHQIHHRELYSYD